MKNLKPAFIVLFSILSVCLILNVLVTCKKNSVVPEGQTLVTQMIDQNKIPIVQGTLNGRKALFILDTGATISVLDINQIQEYGIKDNGVSEDYVVGYGGTDTKTYDLRKVDVRVGDIQMNETFQGKNIANIVETIRKFNHRKIVGIIGNNNIADQDLILNFKTGQVTK